MTSLVQFHTQQPPIAPTWAGFGADDNNRNDALPLRLVGFLV
jgi:hypothetical protein